MIEDKAIKLEPGDYILEYDMEKVARVELINMVEGLCDRGIRLWLVRSRGGDALRIVPGATTNNKEPIQYDGNTIQKDGESIQYPFEIKNTYEIVGKKVFIHLVDAKKKVKAVAVTDSIFAPEVLRRRWCLNGKGYAVSNIKLDDGRRSTLYMHKEVWSMNNQNRIATLLDHIDRNKLNNCIANLREATYRLNAYNKDNKHGHGVVARGNKYSAHLDGVQLGTYLSKEAAQYAVSLREQSEHPPEAITQGKSLCNPAAKEEEQSPLIQELTRNQAYAIEEAKHGAVEAYKKRIVNLLWDEHRFDTEEAAGLYKAIKLVEEVE